MRILYNLNKINNQRTIITFGNFDGFHLAHQNIFKKINNIKKNLSTAIITFSNHPKLFFHPQDNFFIYNYQEKLKILKQQCFDTAYILNFNQEFASIPAEYFIKILVKNLNMDCIVQGYNCNFGYHGIGNYNLITKLQKKYNYKSYLIDEFQINKTTCSSSTIREYIQNGNIELCNQMLNRKFSISGIVHKGQQKGILLGFPTANINIPNDKVIPKKGVYQTITKIGNKEYKSISNIGIRPTFNQDTKIILETHLLDFNQNIYNQQISVYLEKFIRDEQKFQNINELKNQINKDIQKVKKLHFF